MVLAPAETLERTKDSFLPCEASAHFQQVHYRQEVISNKQTLPGGSFSTSFILAIVSASVLGIWLSITLFTFISIFYIYSKTFSLFLGNMICLETVLQLFTNHCFIQNCYAKLATERKLRGVSTYLPIPEALCSKHVWITHSATTISSPRLRPLGGQKYIPMSLFDS